MAQKLFLALLIIFGAGCTAPKTAKTSDPVRTGYQLIDDGKADQAIEHFQALCDEDPDNDDYIRGLSSAYALKGGFQVQILMDPLKAIRSAENFKNDFAPILAYFLGLHPDLKQ